MYLSNPERAEMVEISGTIEDKGRQLRLRCPKELFNQPRWRREAELRPPFSGSPRLERKGLDRPGIIQVEMNRLAQDSNVDADSMKATPHFS